MPKILPIIQDLYGTVERWDVMDYVHSYADPKQVILAYSVFFPEFEVIGGNVILGPIAEEKRQLLARELASEESEKSLDSYRWAEVPYIFQNRKALSAKQDHALAELIARSWLIKLKDEFPDQAWETRVLSPEETGSVVGVAFGNT